MRLSWTAIKRRFEVGCNGALMGGRAIDSKTDRGRLGKQSIEVLTAEEDEEFQRRLVLDKKRGSMDQMKS